MYKTLLPLLMVLLSFGLLAKTKDNWQNYEEVLSKTVETIKYRSKQSGDFYHTAVKTNELRKNGELMKLMQEQVRILKDLEPPTKRNEKLSFWINAYNFFTLLEIQDNPKMESMKAIGWKNKKFSIGNKVYSLNDIEHKILRPLKEPRIHFAINCGSVGCPALQAKPFRPNSLEQALDEAVRNALKNPWNAHVDNSWWRGKHVNVTSLFSWFEADFKVAPYNNIPAFIRKYTSPELGKFAEKFKSNIDYDWSLYSRENVSAKMSEIMRTLPELGIEELSS